MSKGVSGHFFGTKGSHEDTLSNAERVISSRTHGLDLREHPRRNSLSRKQRQEISKKIANRTATKSEYKKQNSDARFSKRRKEGVKRFWAEERIRIISGKPTTRNWTESQKQDIIKNQRPKYNGKTIQGHHTYSAKKFPHLANQGSVIYPVTFDEHLYGWHGGSFKKSLPGKPIDSKIYHSFSGGKKK